MMTKNFNRKKSRVIEPNFANAVSVILTGIVGTALIACIVSEPARRKQYRMELEREDWEGSAIGREMPEPLERDVSWAEQVGQIFSHAADVVGVL